MHRHLELVAPSWACRCRRGGCEARPGDAAMTSYSDVGHAVGACTVTVLPLIGSMSAQAHDPAHPPYPGWEHIKCACLANGHSYEVGQRVCLQTPTGFQMAECKLSQNVTTWALQPGNCD